LHQFGREERDCSLNLKVGIAALDGEWETGRHEHDELENDRLSRVRSARFKETLCDENSGKSVFFQKYRTNEWW
jgi:hypothetical protein